MPDKNGNMVVDKDYPLFTLAEMKAVWEESRKRANNYISPVTDECSFKDFNEYIENNYNIKNKNRI